jgi:hypothetical protein
MKVLRFLRKLRVVLKNLDVALDAFYNHQTLLGKLDSATDELAAAKRRLDDFNLRRQLFLSHSDSELPTKKEDLAEFFASRNRVRTNFELIRVGGAGDGGYLIPNDLEGINALFSPGVDQICEFELFFAQQGVTCFLADGSVDKPPVINPNFRFTRKFVHQGASSKSWINFDDWIRSNSLMDGNSLLQMDIEGGEWQIFSNISVDVLRSFRTIVVEFHGLHQLAYATSFETIRKAMDLLEKHFYLVHLHPNNAESMQDIQGFMVPALLEATYIRKDRVLSRASDPYLANPLDRKNVPGLPDVDLGAFRN